VEAEVGGGGGGAGEQNRQGEGEDGVQGSKNKEGGRNEPIDRHRQKRCVLPGGRRVKHDDDVCKEVVCVWGEGEGGGSLVLLRATRSA